MCTVVILYRPGHPWPLLLAANRDEMAERSWRPPGRHWRHQPQVMGGLDMTAGGTWLARNDAGVIAAVLNRINTLGPAPGRRSRGELPLRALAVGTAGEAARMIGEIDAWAWRPFNMVVADAREAFWIRATHDREAGRGGPAEDGAGDADRQLVVERLPAGLSMITAHDRNDARSPRIRRYLPKFRAAREPRPERSDWQDWVALMAARESDADAGPGGAMTVITAGGFGTVCASLMALPADDITPPVWLFAAGRPGEAPFTALDRGAVARPGADGNRKPL
jgi:hypothetical protein